MATDLRRLTNEAPTTVGLMTSVIESGGSLDVAARTVAEEGPPISRGIFSRAVRLADTKGADGVRGALVSGLAELGDAASGYRQAMMLCISAADSGDRSERLRILGEASDTALEAVRIMGEKYSASLSTPCMTVFGLGIMVPMILMSILPLMGIGGLFGTASIDENLIVVGTLFLVPLTIMCVAWWIRSTNPFMSDGLDRRGASSLLPLATAPVMHLIGTSVGLDVVESMLVAMAFSCFVCLMLMAEGKRADDARLRSEEGLRDCVFEIGNSLLAGENFEKASVEVLLSRPDCAAVGASLERELDLCRGDVGGAVRRAVSPVSPEVSRTLCDIRSCSLKDTEDAGRLATAVGRQFQNGSGIRKELGLRLKSMTDMMLGTAVVFAPMILGMSVSMLDPLSSISDYQGMEDSSTVIAVYVLELCALIAVLTTSLSGRGGVRDIGWRFCIMAPIALLVLLVCSAITFRRDYTGVAGFRGMEFRRRVLVVAVAVTAALLALVVLAPYMAPYGSFRHLDGSATFIDGGWEGHGFVSVIYAIGDVFCHQEEGRSFMLNGSQLPVCIRDTGILLGLPVGFALCLALGDRLEDRRVAWIGAVLVLLMGAEWLYETTGADIGWLRFASGVSAGIGAALFLGWLLCRDTGSE